MIYTQAQFEDSMRKTLTPSLLSTYLPTATPSTTPTLSAGVPTKFLVTSTIVDNTNFTFDTPNTRYFFDATGVSGRRFSVGFWTSISASATNTVVSLELYVNGVVYDGVSVSRKFANADIGALGSGGEVVLNDGDYTEIYITSSLGGTLTFSRSSIIIKEIN